MDRKIVNISVLGQAEDGFYKIKDDSNIYLVDDNSKICIEAGAKAYIIDQTKNKEIYVKSLEDSSLDYIILDSYNSKRTFDNYGEVIINEVLLSDSNESSVCNLLKENASFDKKALAFAEGMHQKVAERVNHESEKTYSNIYNVGISMVSSVIDFDITGFINKGMSKTNCRQLSKGIVIDDDSEVICKPILLIDEYDCFANHGASIGKMSDEDLFYLMSRGLSKNEAFSLIVTGIIKPFIDVIPNEELKNSTLNTINKMIEKW